MDEKVDKNKYDYLAYLIHSKNISSLPWVIYRRFKKKIQTVFCRVAAIVEFLVCTGLFLYINWIILLGFPTR